MKVLVVGATGLLGGETCERLIARGEEVRAMVRPTSDPGRVEWLRQLGAELVTADLKDRPSVDRACRGVDSVVSTAIGVSQRQPGDSVESVDLGGHLSLVAAATAAHVRRFVYVSFTAYRVEKIAFPYRDAKREVEKAIQASGLEYTILRPTFFMETWVGPDEGFNSPDPAWTIYGAGENKVTWISRHDVAEFAVQTLLSPRGRNRVLELGGPEALSPRETIRIFERVTGKKFQVKSIPEEALLREPANALAVCFARGDEVSMTDTLREFPVKLTTVEDHARAMAASSRKQ
ncbi:MAG TPA: SDR family oxidoreductase [Thermoplasmata archaeon]|nr:SDR family oxidoreductase [Thermoplasmata archaeon]